MEHVQQQILDAAKAALVAAGTDAGVRVYLDHADPLEVADLPAIELAEAPQGEDVDAKTVSGAESRVYSVLVSCVVAGGADYARRARELGRQVEVALTARAAPLPRPGRAQLAAARMTLEGDGESLLAKREQLWRFTYTTRRGAPDIAL